MFGPDAGNLILSVAMTQVVVCCTDSRNMSALRPVSGPPTIIFEWQYAENELMFSRCGFHVRSRTMTADQRLVCPGCRKILGGFKGAPAAVNTADAGLSQFDCIKDGFAVPAF